MDPQKLPISEDGKRLAVYFEEKLEEMKKEIIEEMKKDTPKKQKSAK